MQDYFEIDFIKIDAKNSGDAITIRYCKNDEVGIHVVDGGYIDTGEQIVKHIDAYYEKPKKINNVVVTHPDNDHAGGLRKVLESYEVGNLWMLRPWMYAEELIDRFARFTSVENLQKRLLEIYSSIAALEEIALEKKIPIKEPFQGANIGPFIVMAPTRERYYDLIVESEKTPEAAKDEESKVIRLAERLLEEAKRLVLAPWGLEAFSIKETSAENEMSVIQYADLFGIKILLTGDTGRSGLKMAAEYAPNVGLKLPRIDRFQVPHHGSRRNVSAEILDLWLGPKLQTKPEKGQEKCRAYISAAKEDKNHPRKAVIRALIHRGAKVLENKGETLSVPYMAAARDGWVAAEQSPYPEEQEQEQ